MVGWPVSVGRCNGPALTLTLRSTDKMPCSMRQVTWSQNAVSTNCQVMHNTPSSLQRACATTGVSSG
ncbi:hypothetical protein MBAV_001118 [Candidatus Magnetobacterium bavaricum]|uniref:Uncharacterized protein n=1 Tax=Candidatus Magnetobacterium bavaricum TaxID=29290 RepID=A0A0F3GXH7_9BACT|nr:hypothetical protein MBAV_001118 [Candidatus Magnetobacterium bavaricum]